MNFIVKQLNIKIVTLWLLSLISIPLLSLYGRPLQAYMVENFTRSQMTLVIGCVFALMSAYVIIRLLQSGSYQKLWHLLWFVPLFIVLPMYLPIVEERIHFIVFGLFGYLSLKVMPVNYAVGLCIIIAFADEGFQWWLPDRVGDWRDVAMNVIAVSGGLGFGLADNAPQKN